MPDVTGANHPATTRPQGSFSTDNKRPLLAYSPARSVRLPVEPRCQFIIDPGPQTFYTRQVQNAAEGLGFPKKSPRLAIEHPFKSHRIPGTRCRETSKAIQIFDRGRKTPRLRSQLLILANQQLLVGKISASHIARLCGPAHTSYTRRPSPTRGTAKAKFIQQRTRLQKNSGGRGKRAPRTAHPRPPHNRRALLQNLHGQLGRLAGKTCRGTTTVRVLRTNISRDDEYW